MHTLQRSKYDSEAGFPHVAEQFASDGLFLFSLFDFSRLRATVKRYHHCKQHHDGGPPWIIA